MNNKVQTLANQKKGKTATIRELLSSEPSMQRSQSAPKFFFAPEGLEKSRPVVNFEIRLAKPEMKQKEPIILVNDSMRVTEMSDFSFSTHKPSPVGPVSFDPCLQKSPAEPKPEKKSFEKSLVDSAAKAGQNSLKLELKTDKKKSALKRKGTPRIPRGVKFEIVGEQEMSTTFFQNPRELSTQPDITIQGSSRDSSGSDCADVHSDRESDGKCAFFYLTLYSQQKHLKWSEHICRGVP